MSGARSRKRTILVTGGAGFIGSTIVRQYLVQTDVTIVNIDKLTYAGNIDSLGSLRNHPRHQFHKVDIGDRTEVDRVLAEHRPDAIMNLAAESHVDRSIEGHGAFIETNIVGTYSLLESVRSYWNDLDPGSRKHFRFHHVSTDEVFGDLGHEGRPANETTPYAPSSPYSSTKASSDHLVRAWARTYGLPVVITNCSNNYGPYQFPEKLIPLMILNAMEGRPLPVYGRGENVRDWLYVEDHADALRLVLAQGETGRTYNIGGRSEKTNLEVVQAVCELLDRLAPDPNGRHDRLIQYVKDRPGHDLRYAIDDSRIRRELGWQPCETFASGLERTVRWYLDNTTWVERVRTGAYREWIESNYGHRGPAE